MPQYDPLWLDRMYNNRALVPDHAQHFAQWAQASEHARDAHAHQLDIAYGSDAMQTLDVFPSAHHANKTAPVVVFIHGGYWRSLDKSDHSFIAPAFTNQGACVVVPNYALCPAVSIAQIVMQMVQALAWTYRNAHRFGGDAQRITVIGHSAGGHLATMLLACQWRAYAPDLPADVVKNAMSISGLYDLEPVMHTPFLKDSLRLTPDVARISSPAWMPRPPRGTLYTLVGADESPEFVRHNGMMQSAWGIATVPVCETVPQRNHFSVLEDLTMPWQRLHQLASALALGG
jgi:arylformamidase